MIDKFVGTDPEMQISEFLIKRSNYLLKKGTPKFQCTL